MTQILPHKSGITNYRCFHFFKELLYTVHCQTYTNWELCLADGSPKPLKKIEEICKKDRRIKYHFIGENKGISGNTNEAIKLATGDYISLLDHDDLLTEDCKKVFYPTKKEFEEKYYKPIFTNKKTFNLSYISSDNNLKTYKLEILDDILTMGKFDETKVHEELITIVQEQTTEKLNINNFIKVEEINKTEATENLILTINKRYIFADYEKYEIDVFNATEDYLKLDPLEIEKTAFLLDSNDKMFYIDRNKMSDVDVQIYPYTNRKTEVYFNKKYVEGSIIKSINFISIQYKTKNEEKSDKIQLEM